MLRRNFIKGLSFISIGSTIPISKVLAKTEKKDTDHIVEGTVVNQINKGIPDVVVSDGFLVTKTDSKGHYKLRPHEKATFVFISLPAGYEIPHNKGIALFYEKLRKTDAPQTIDFKLKKLNIDDHKHAFIAWADPQIQSEADKKQFMAQSVPDTLSEFKQLSGQPLHGISCGDLVFDHPEFHETYKEGISSLGVPFFQVIGNHDEDYGARTDEYSEETFMHHYGPSNFSFNRGKIHYLMLDNVFFVGEGHRYIGYLSEDQLQWIEQDLHFIPKGSNVIVSMHIPSWTGDARRTNSKEDSMGGVILNRQALYDLLKPYKVHIISGHTHWNENWEKKDMMEHNIGTLCGAWWTGPVCGDGTPAGYMVFTVDGDDIRWYFKPSGQSAKRQMSLYREGACPINAKAFVANVWNYDPEWKVEWIENGENKGNMTAFTGYDPLAYELYFGPTLPKKHKWVEPVLTDHLFYAQASSQESEIIVRATDRWGNTYEEKLTRNA